jgi:hypothetical protein
MHDDVTAEYDYPASSAVRDPVVWLPIVER